MECRRLPGSFGCEITGLTPYESSDAELRELLKVLYAERFVVLRTEGITKPEYVALARRLGDPITLSGDQDFPEIANITNIGIDSQSEKRGAAHWHSDQSFRSRRASITMLYAVEAPAQGGDTQFCDLAGAWTALDKKYQDEIRDYEVAHQHGVSVSARPGDHTPIAPKGWDQNHTVTHPLVMTHPESGVETLYAISGTPQSVIGQSPEDGERLLNHLCEHAFQPDFLNQHHYRKYDIVMWDNPTTMHSASPIGPATRAEDTRLLYRISLTGSPPVRRTKV